MERFLKNLRYIKLKDIWAIFLFIFAILPAAFLKLFTKNKIWLICEEENEARDNAYVFFKYLCKISDETVYPIYAINKKSPDYKKVEKLGKVISYGGYVHWIYYLAAKYNISSQKGGKPNAAVCYFLEIYNLLKNRRIFLQHGITKDDADWLYYKNTKMRLFICGAKPEYEFVKEKFGYPEDNVKYVGFPRFDELHNLTVKPKQILIMPSWRAWLNRKTDAYYKFEYDGIFEHSEYFKNWNSFLNNKKLKEFAEKNDLDVIFYPHRNMQQYLDKFSVNSEKIKIASWKEYDIQQLLKESAIMITDFSSVAFDFAYMKKPILYYIFDIEQFREGQYKKGYYDYEKNALGFASKDENEIIDELIKSYNNGFSVKADIKEKMDEFFDLNDEKNCERVYKEIKKIK